MPGFNYIYYAYLNEINEIPKLYHQLFKHKEEPGMTITTPKILLNNLLIQFPTIFVGKMLVPQIQVNVWVVVKLSRINVWNQQSHKMKTCLLQERTL